MKQGRKIKIAQFAFAAASSLLLVNEAAATTTLSVRCSLDAIDPATARKRLEWARACGVKINVKSPTTPAPPAIKYQTGTFDVFGVPLTEYLETDDFWGKNSYSGDVAAVNQIYTQNQWRLGPITASTAAGGFQKWTEPETLVLTRPLYPTFGNGPFIDSSLQLFPNPNYALNDCALYKDAAATIPADVSVTGFFVNGFCTSSCYTPEQEVAFADGNQKIVDAIAKLTPTMKTLTADSTLQNVQTQNDEVMSYTREIRDTTHVIFEIRTESGGQLRVTAKHPVLEGNGRMVEAESIKAGSKLIKADGSLDTVVSVTKTEHFGKVYNLKPRSGQRVSNILIAQGFLVGSSRYQNEDVDLINRIILGRGIPADKIPQ